MGIARMSSTISMASSNDANSATGIKYKHVGEDNKVRLGVILFSMIAISQLRHSSDIRVHIPTSVTLISRAHLHI